MPRGCTWAGGPRGARVARTFCVRVSVFFGGKRRGTDGKLDLIFATLCRGTGEYRHHNFDSPFRIILFYLAVM